MFVLFIILRYIHHDDLIVKMYLFNLICDLNILLRLAVGQQEQHVIRVGGTAQYTNHRQLVQNLKYQNKNERNVVNLSKLFYKN